MSHHDLYIELESNTITETPAWVVLMVGQNPEYKVCDNLDTQVSIEGLGRDRVDKRHVRRQM
jgi:hypothetical protein